MSCCCKLHDIYIYKYHYRSFIYIYTYDICVCSRSLRQGNGLWLRHISIGDPLNKSILLPSFPGKVGSSVGGTGTFVTARTLTYREWCFKIPEMSPIKSLKQKKQWGSFPLPPGCLECRGEFENWEAPLPPNELNFLSGKMSITYPCPPGCVVS